MDPADPGRGTGTDLCHAGICAEDLEAHTGESPPPAYAREIRVGNRSGGRSSSRLRRARDTLAPHNVVPSGLAPVVPQASNANIPWMGPEEVSPGDFLLEMLRRCPAPPGRRGPGNPAAAGFRPGALPAPPLPAGRPGRSHGHVHIRSPSTAYTAADIKQVNAVIAATYRDGLNGHGHPAA